MGKNTKNESQISAKLMRRSSARFMGAKYLTHHKDHLQQCHTRVMKINGMVFLARKWALAFVQPFLQLHFFSGADSCKWQSAELKMHGYSSQDGGQWESTYLIFNGHDTIPLSKPQPIHHSHTAQIYVLTHST